MVEGETSRGRKTLLALQRGEPAVAGGRELLARPIRHGGSPPQGLPIETEPVGVLSRDLALGAVPGGVDVAGLGHLPEEAEVLHDELLRATASGNGWASTTA